jgi:hypothetical protein
MIGQVTKGTKREYSCALAQRSQAITDQLEQSMIPLEPAFYGFIRELMKVQLKDDLTMVSCAKRLSEASEQLRVAARI